MQIKLSIVIPLYNVASYIPRCFDSIYGSNVSEDLFEVVVVDDGSSDNSVEVIKEQQRNHTNLILIQTGNNGVSVARNIGVCHSHGEYLIFLDPDDGLCVGALKQLINYLMCIDSSTCPVVIMTSFDAGGKEIYKWKTKFAPHKRYNSLDVLNKGYVRGSVCGCLFRSAFIKDNRLQFMPDVRNGEDTIFLFTCMYMAENVEFHDLPFYNVIGRECSASKSITPLAICKWIDTIPRISRLAESLPRKDSLPPMFEHLKYAMAMQIVRNTIVHSLGFSILEKNDFRRYCRINTRGIIYNRYKMSLMNVSLRLYYLLQWIKYAK